MKRRLLRALLVALGYLPLPLVDALASALGSILWWLPTRQKQITLFHLERCLPELSAGQRRKIARASLLHTARSVLEAPAVWFGPESRLLRWVDQTSAQGQLRALLASGRGLIVLCPHLGSWEIAGMFCARAGPIATLYKPQKGEFDALILEGRARLGAKLVPTAGSGVRALLAALKNAEMVGILPDHDPPIGSGVFAPFFGIPAHTTALVSKLAARTGAPVWFCVAERLAWGRGFRIRLEPAPAEIADSAHGAAVLNAGVEERLRELPEQYWWSYKRYRRRPQGEPDFYAGV